MLKILVACEESQTITKKVREIGGEAFSCDVEPCSGGHPEWHIQDDVVKVLDGGWDVMIAHPPCTYLTVTGNAWYYHPDDSHLPTDKRRPHPRFPNRQKKKQKAINFFMGLAKAPIDKIAIENPVGVMSTEWRKPDQIIQPYHFGDPHSKRTCLWLKNLPKLRATKIVKPEFVTYKSGKKHPKWVADTIDLPPKERNKVRSKTFNGIANAIVNQWIKPLL